MDHWSVAVARSGEQVVCIESNCLSGRDISYEDETVIRSAAHSLLGFIGDPHPDYDELTKLRADVAKLRAALEPFSRYINRVDPAFEGEIGEFFDGTSRVCIRYTDLRRARDAIEETGE